MLLSRPDHQDLVPITDISPRFRPTQRLYHSSIPATLAEATHVLPRDAATQLLQDYVTMSAPRTPRRPLRLPYHVPQAVRYDVRTSDPTPSVATFVPRTPLRPLRQPHHGPHPVRCDARTTDPHDVRYDVRTTDPTPSVTTSVPWTPRRPLRRPYHGPQAVLERDPATSSIASFTVARPQPVFVATNSIGTDDPLACSDHPGILDNGPGKPTFLGTPLCLPATMFVRPTICRRHRSPLAQRHASVNAETTADVRHITDQENVAADTLSAQAPRSPSSSPDTLPRYSVTFADRRRTLS